MVHSILYVGSKTTGPPGTKLWLSLRGPAAQIKGDGGEDSLSKGSASYHSRLEQGQYVHQFAWFGIVVSPIRLCLKGFKLWQFIQKNDRMCETYRVIAKGSTTVRIHLQLSPAWSWIELLIVPVVWVSWNCFESVFFQVLVFVMLSSRPDFVLYRPCLALVLVGTKRTFEFQLEFVHMSYIYIYV